GPPVNGHCEPLVHAEEAEQVNLGGFARPVTTFRIEGFKPQGAKQVDRSWPLKVYTLGQFSMLRDGQPVVFSRKVQRRPLDLMKVLIANGGVRTDIATLMGSMWPDAE